MQKMTTATAPDSICLPQHCDLSIRGCFITTVKSKARFHESDFDLNRGSIAVAM